LQRTFGGMRGIGVCSFFLFRAGKNTAGAVSHEIEAVFLQPKSWRMASPCPEICKAALCDERWKCDGHGVTVTPPSFTFVLSIAAHSTKQMLAKK